MSFFPSDGYRTGAILGGLNLCLIDTADGPARFMIGTDGIFTDANGHRWYGSQLASTSSLEIAIGGTAPEGSITLSYFQDPDADDLIEKVRELGLDYVRGRDVAFYVQLIRNQSEFYAPVVPPIHWIRRVSRGLTYRFSGAQDRSISLSFEAWSENRRAARRIVLNTEGHARLIDEENPSLEFIPTSNFEEVKLFR